MTHRPPSARGLVLQAVTAACALLPLSHAVRADDFADYDMDFQYCASLEGEQLSLRICVAGCSYFAQARLVAPLPGTFLVDLHYLADSSNSTVLTIHTASGAGSFVASPACSPCSGDMLDIPIDVKAGDLVTIELQPVGSGCLSDGFVNCIFSNLRFLPAPGVSALGGAIDAALMLNVEPGSIDVDEAIGPIAMVEDVDGDGRADVACAMPNWGPPATIGRVLVLSGATGAVLREWTGTTSSSRLGSALANAGDLDGDDLDDLVAAEYIPKTRVRAFSPATGTELSSIELPFFAFPFVLDGAGDVDADGRGDIVVGYKSASASGLSMCGRVSVYSGATQALLHESFGDFAQDQLGELVAGAGDVDADGFDDYLATASHHPTGLAANGLVRVYSGLTGQPLYSFVGLGLNEHLGEEADSAGDFDADGHADIIATARGAVAVNDLVRVYSGASGTALFTSAGVHPEDSIGRSVARAGDLDGDGFDDVIATSTLTNDGHWRLYAFGGPAGRVLIERHPLDYASYGDPVEAGHDADGDGKPDLLLLARTMLSHERLQVLSGVPAQHLAPVLGATGTLLPGSPLTIHLSGGPPGGSALFVVGARTLYLPFKGGYLVPSPGLLVPNVPLQTDGSLQFSMTWPAPLTAPAFVVLQAWLAEPSAVHGFLASNGLLLAPP